MSEPDPITGHAKTSSCMQEAGEYFQKFLVASQEAGAAGSLPITSARELATTAVQYTIIIEGFRNPCGLAFLQLAERIN